MQSVGKRYVYYVNKNYGRTGRLWESRYRPFVVETERYLLACYRYTDLNPVNAGLVDTPEKYPWSSFAHHALGVCNELISPHPVYLALGRNPTERQRAYRRLFDEGVNLTVDDLVESQGVGLQVIGTRRFRSRIERLTGRRLTPRKRGRPKHGKKVPGTN
jgi:putative transposase